METKETEERVNDEKSLSRALDKWDLNIWRWGNTDVIAKNYCVNNLWCKYLYELKWGDSTV